MLLALVFVLARNIIKLLVERRRAIPFARFRAKLVFVLLGMTLVPALLVLLVGSNVVLRAMGQWFNEPVEEVLSSASQLAADYYRRAPAGGGRTRRRGWPRPSTTADLTSTDLRAASASSSPGTSTSGGSRSFRSTARNRCRADGVRRRAARRRDDAIAAARVAARLRRPARLARRLGRAARAGVRGSARRRRSDARRQRHSQQRAAGDRRGRRQRLPLRAISPTCRGA